MKKLFVLLTIVLLTTSAFALESPWEKKLPFKASTIKYTVGGSMKGSKTLYIKDYGRTKAEYINTTMTVFGIAQQQQTITITTPDWEYKIDLIKNKGTKNVNPKKYLNEEFHKLSKSKQKKVIKNTKKTAVDIAKGTNGSIQINAAKILGYKCDKAIIMGITGYSITGTDISLKINGNLMGIQIEETATSIKKGKPSSSKFKVPSNMKITHDKQTDRTLKQHAKSTIQSLVNGNAKTKSSGNYQGGHQNTGGANGQQLTPEQQKQMKQMMQMFGGQQ